MKTTKLDIVRDLLAANTHKSEQQMLAHGENNVNDTRRSKRYKQYF